MKKLALACLFLLMNSCGQLGPKGAAEANFFGNGYSMLVEQQTINTYKFTVVENNNFQGAIFSVYGLQSDSQVGNFNPNTRVRLAHVADGANVGDSFEVTFNSDDSWFIIYEDALIGGSFQFDLTSEMIRGQFR